MSRIQFGVVGAGWRAEFFLRIAAAAPEHFELPTVVARNPENAKRFAATWQSHCRVGNRNARRWRTGFCRNLGIVGGQPPDRLK